jgi:hypothetical protein
MGTYPHKQRLVSFRQKQEIYSFNPKLSLRILTAYTPALHLVFFFLTRLCPDQIHDSHKLAFEFCNFQSGLLNKL